MKQLRCRAQRSVEGSSSSGMRSSRPIQSLSSEEVLAANALIVEENFFLLLLPSTLNLFHLWVPSECIVYKNHFASRASDGVAEGVSQSGILFHLPDFQRPHFHFPRSCCFSGASFFLPALMFLMILAGWMALCALPGPGIPAWVVLLKREERVWERLWCSGVERSQSPGD